MEEYIGVINELIVTFRELTQIGSMKLSAGREQRVVTVEECMKKEQPLVMKLRGLEMKRESLQAELGFEGMSFHQILEEVSEEEQKKLLPSFEGLSRVIQMFQVVNEDAQKMMKLNLREVEKAIERNKQNHIESGKKEYTGKGHTDRSV